MFRYFAEVAAGDSESLPYIGDVTFVEYATDGLFTQESMRRLESLTRLDRLHAEENQLWQGRLWVVGTIAGTRYFWPLIRGRARNQMFTVQLSSPTSWQVTPGFVNPKDIERIAASDDIWRQIPMAPSAAEYSASRYPRLNRWVTKTLASMGLPKLPITTTCNPTDDDSPQVLATAGFYLDYEPYSVNRSATLGMWRSQKLDQSVLSDLYMPPPDSTTASAKPVYTTLPLNQRQRAAIETVNQSPLAVVSGPPGTGKSHLVAAAAIAEVAAGRSVLIAAKSIHACDVIVDLLDRYPMVAAQRFGADRSSQLISNHLAAGVPPTDDDFDERRLEAECDRDLEQITNHRNQLLSRIGELQDFDDALSRRHDMPLWLAQKNLASFDIQVLRQAHGDLETRGPLGPIKRRRAKSLASQQLGRVPDDFERVIAAVEADALVSAIAGRDLGLDELWNELDRSEEQWRKRVGDLLEAQRRGRASTRNRAALGEFASALRRDVSARKTALAEVGERFLEVAPLWVGTLGEIETVLPTRPGLFDLVILDEASQISQMSAVPALARGKRAMIVGDSRQLRHVSTVSAAAQTEAARRIGIAPELESLLDDHTNSIFDVATAVAPVIALDEHFRSAPHIIGFSDREFYDSRLKLMTQHPRHESRDAIDVVHVVGDRGEHGAIAAEVEAVLLLTHQLVNAQRESVGIVSPFQAQADAIESAILEQFTLDQIERSRLRVGTVHGFQGTERDHVIISLGLGAHDTEALAFVEDPAVFNVMVTRARNHITLVSAIDAASAGSGLLGRYLRHEQAPPNSRPETVDGAGWTTRLAQELSEHGAHRVITNYEVAGEHIDIVIGDSEHAFGIETETHPAGAERHIERRLALKRAGWEIVSLHRATCYGREEQVITELLASLATRPELSASH